jgi:hypothetical protein
MLPGEPADRVVLAVSIVVTALGAAELITCAEHRHSLTQQERGQEVAALTVPNQETRTVWSAASDRASAKPYVLEPLGNDLRIRSLRAGFDFNIVGHSFCPVDTFCGLLGCIFVPIAMRESGKCHHAVFNCYGNIAA